jgi:small nuclear ribonucleoprotein (snRNP)-like protein
MEKVDYYNNKTKVFNHYAKDSSRSQGTKEKDFGTQERKPLRYSQDSFVKELINKTLTIELVNGKILTGKLLQLGMFDILIELKSVETVNIAGKPMLRDVIKNLIILKSSILTVEVMQ